MKILLTPNPTGTGHNMRLFNIGKKLLQNSIELEVEVLLGSMQNVFKPLFESENIKVIDLNPTGIIDYSTESLLDVKLNWDSMIKKWIVPTFFNGDKILRYMELIMEEEPDYIISDYNTNATVAADLMKVKNIFVTERHNYAVVGVEIDDYKLGGFDVNEKEMFKARRALNATFDWILDNAELIITDKPYIAELDRNKLIHNYVGNKKFHFVGSMYTSRDKGEKFQFSELGINENAPYIVGTVSGTTMLKEDKEKNIEIYVKVYHKLKEQTSNLQLVLIGNIDRQHEDGVIIIPYVPNWIQLISNSILLISHPGWITVTEVAKLGIPTLFYLPNFMEYHEVEAYRLLEYLGVPVFMGDDINKFTERVLSITNSINKRSLYKGYDVIAPPNSDGLEKAIEVIKEKLEEKQNEKI